MHITRIKDKTTDKNPTAEEIINHISGKRQESELQTWNVVSGALHPGYDHRHDEESRNGRDIKIDILEAYIWTSE